MEQIQPQLDQMKAEAQKQKDESGVDTSVPVGFGLPQADADTFKPIKIKSKKRNLEEAQATDQIKTNPTSADHSGEKRKKIEDENPNTNVVWFYKMKNKNDKSVLEVKKFN